MEIHFFDELDSTNKYAKEHISEYGDKTVIYTSKQTAGRGRLERKWNYLGENNIYASIILKPSNQMKEVYSNITQYLCLVLCEVFEEYDVIPQIKWPNDIKIRGKYGDKKISGILAESVINSNKLEGLVLGFGVNLNCDKSLLDQINQPATALNIETGFEINREDFLKNLLAKFCLRYDRFIEEGFSLIREDYIRRVNFLNKEIAVKVFDKTITGFAKDITDNGALKLIDKENKEHILLIGDIL